MKAVIASVRSSEASAPAFQVATNSRPSATVRPSLAVSTAFVPRTASGEFGGDLPGERRGVRQEGLVVGADTVHEPDRLRPRRGDVLARVGEFGNMSFADDVREPLEASQVGDDRDLRLPDREDRVRAGQTDVARGREVDATTEAVPLDRGDHRNGALGDRGDRCLHAQHVGTDRERRGRRSMSWVPVRRHLGGCRAGRPSRPDPARR